MAIASDRIKIFKNANGPVITTVDQPVLEKDGLYFKDIDGSGELKAFSDWRLSPEERTDALVKDMSLDEKVGQLFATSRNMAKYPDPRMKLPEGESKKDESGLLDENPVENASIFAGYKIPGTTDAIRRDGMRNFIVRANPKPEDLTDWINQLQHVAENQAHYLPVLIISNNRNENGKIVFGMNDAIGIFPAWPGTLGIASAILGDRIEIAKDFGEAVRKEWDAAGMKKGYMYMADVVTDPRWQRIYGTFGENPLLNGAIMSNLIPAIQGSEDGVTTDGVAVTIKHWPGGGARENGFDPHYKEGQWNVYATENSLEKFHLPPFQDAISCNPASMMPYYAKPSKEKSAPQNDINGQPIEWQPVGFAFNDYFISKLLRDECEFKGYVNSDSGIIDNMGWGVENLDRAERIALAINNGVDIISESYGVEYAKEAVARRTNGYYDEHPIPEGYTLEQITLDEKAIDRAVKRTLTEKFALGAFDNPFRDPKGAVEAITNSADWQTAQEVHVKSVVILKNKDNTIPFSTEGKTLYVKGIDQTEKAGEAWTKALREELEGRGVKTTDDLDAATDALIMVSPNSGNYFSATKGLLEIDLAQDKVVADFSSEGLPLETTHEETTAFGIKDVPAIAEPIHTKGGKVLGTLNITMPWIPKNLEPYCDVLLAGFDTNTKALFDIMFGLAKATGRLPITLPAGDEVIAVNEKGVCISPNDVPGYLKDNYLPEEMKDENGKAYAYRDEMGNYYQYGFGLKD